MNEGKSGATPLEGDGKRILLVLGTPKKNSLCHALAEAYSHGARSRGHVVRQLKLGEMQFDPILRDGYEQSQSLEPDLLEAQRLIHWAEHLVFVYPVWWGGIPALLKGFFDRVFLPGFAFKYRNRSQLWDKLLTGRSADLLVTLDTPRWYFRWIYGAPAHRQMVRTILGFCGIKTRRLTEFSPVRPSSEEQRQGVEAFFQRIPFNQVLGIRIDELSGDRVVMSLPMKPELIGNFVHGILHGGVISSLLDVAGGAMALIGAFANHQHLPPAERMSKLSKLGTIDLRIDYLRPGRGQRFTATAMPLRAGNKVAVIRMELHNDEGVLVAVGTGTYLCG